MNTKAQFAAENSVCATLHICYASLANSIHVGKSLFVTGMAEKSLVCLQAKADMQVVRSPTDVSEALTVTNSSAFIVCE